VAWPVKISTDFPRRYGFIVPDGAAAGNRQENASIYKQSTTSRRKRRLKVFVNAFDNEKSHEMLQSPGVWQKDETREKEIERAKKWKVMATSMTNGTKSSRWRRVKSSEKLAEGAGMNWKFSTKDPKVIEELLLYLSLLYPTYCLILR